MKVLPITRYDSYFNNNNENNLSFKAYKHMGKAIISSAGLFVSAVAAAFLDAPKEDVVEISTVDNDSDLSETAYKRLMDEITKLKKSNEVKPVSREKYKTDYIPPKEEQKNEYIQEDPTDDYEYLAKRIYCYSDMM